MPSRKPKPYRSKKAKSNFPQIRSLDPNQAGRDVVLDIMEGGRERWCFSPPRTYPSSIFSSPQVRNRYPDQRGRDIQEEIMAEGRESKESSPPGGHRSSTPTQQQIRNLDPEQRGRDIPEEIMAEGRESKESSPAGGHRSSRPTQQQVRNLDPDQRGRDDTEEIMAEGRESKDSSPPGGHRSSTPTQQQIRNLDPDQRDRDIPEEIMAEGRESKESSPAGGHRSSPPTQQQYRDRQPYVRRPQQYQDHRTYEPRPGPEGGHPHYPEQYPSSQGAERTIRNLDPEQRGRDDPEEIMAEGRGRRDSSPAGGHRSSRPTQQQYRDRQPYVRRPQQYQDHRTYEPRPGPEGGHPHYPEQYPSSRGAERTIRNLDPEQRGRDDPEEIMAEGRGRRDSSPAGGHRSSRPTQQQYRDRQPYVRRPQQYQDHRTYEPRPGPEGGHPHYPEQYPSSRGAERTVRDRYPEQRGRDIPEEIMAEGRESKESSPAGGHRSSRPTQQQYHHRQPYVRPTQQYYEHRSYEPCPGPEGRQPHYPERPVYSGANRMVRDRYPDQRGRDDTEEIMAEGRGSRHASPPGGHRSSPPTQPQYRDRQPYVRRPQQYQDHRTYEPRPGPEGGHPHYPEQYPSSQGAERRIHDRYPDQRGRDDTEEVMAEGRESRYSTPPGGHRSSRPIQQQYHHRQPYVRPTQQYYEHRSYEPRPGPEGRQPHCPEQYPSSQGAERRVRDRYPDQRGRDDTEEVMAEGRESRYSTPPGGHRSSRPIQQQYCDRQPYVRRPQQYQDHRTYEPRPGPEGGHPHYPEQYPSSQGAERRIHDRYPDQRGRDDPEEIMAEGRESRDLMPPGRHRSSRPIQQQYHHRQPYVRPTQQYYEHRTYEPRPGPEGRQPHCPEQYPSSRGADRMVHDRYPDQRGRDVTEEVMAEGRESRDLMPPGGHRSSPSTPQQVHDRYPDQRGRDDPEEIMAEGRESRDLMPPGRHRSSPPTQPQYHHRQPYVRPTQQYQDHRTYEPRPGPEGRQPHCPERPVYSGVNRMVHDRYPDQRGRDVTEEVMAEGRESRDLMPPGGHRSSPSTPQQVHDRYPDQRGRDDPEEIMAEGRESRDLMPPGRHRSSPPTQPQYHHRQPYVRPTQQYQDHRTYEPRPGPEGRQPHCPERPVYSGVNRMVHDRYPDQRGRDVTEEIMAEGRGSRYSTPPGGHRSSRPIQQQYHHRQPYVRPTQQYQDHRTYEPRPGPEGRQPHCPERPVYSGVNRMVHDRYPDQRGRDVTEEIMAEGRESRDLMPPGGHRSSPPTQPQDLFRKVRSILNKLTPQKFIQLRNQLLDLTINTEERLKGVVDLLYERAINEPCFLVTYAKMCGCLATLIVPTAENSSTKVNFHKLLLRRCQGEFQKETVDDVTKPKKLYSAVLKERHRLQVEPEEAKDITQQRFIGNIKLLCELFKLNMLNDFIVQDCCDKLLRNNEVALESLCIFLTTISKGHNCDETKMVHYLKYMEDIVREGKTSSRIRSMLEQTINTIDLTLNLSDQVGQRSSSPRLVTPSLAPPNPPTKDEPLLDEPSTALSVAAPEALNSLAETRTELESAGHDMRPQDPTPPQCPNSEAMIPLKSRSSSGKRGRKGRKRHNKPPYAGSPR